MVVIKPGSASRPHSRRLRDIRVSEASRREDRRGRFSPSCPPVTQLAIYYLRRNEYNMVRF